MLVRGRRVYPRHLFPELVAPWIHLGRLRLRMIWFFTTPIHIVPLWTTSVVAGILGVMLTILLFRQAPQVQAATVATHIRPAARMIPASVPVPPPEADFFPSSQFAPELTSDVAANLWTRLDRTTLRGDWDQRRQVTLSSLDHRPIVTRAPVSSIRDGWLATNEFRTSQPANFMPYRRLATRWNGEPPASSLLSSDEPAVFGGTNEREPSLVVLRETQAAAFGSEAQSYVIIVQNTGHDLLNDLVISETVSHLDRVTATEPPAEVSEQALHWRVNSLPAGQQQRFVVTFMPEAGIEFAGVTDVRTTISLSSLTLVNAPPEPTPPVRSSIPSTLPPEEPLEVFTPPAQLPVEPASNEFRPPARAIAGEPKLSIAAEFPASMQDGDELSTIFVIRNTGTADAYNVTLKVQVPSRMEHREGQLVEHRIAHLPAGGMRRAIFRAVAREKGEAGFDAELIHGESVAANWSARVSILGKPGTSTARKQPAENQRGAEDCLPQADRVSVAATYSP